MKKRLQKEFDEIAAEAIGRVEQIDCEFDEFVEGLRNVVAELSTRLNLAVDEQRHRNEKG